MYGDHESAANQRDENLCRVRRKKISPIRAPEDEGQTEHHEYQNARGAMLAVTLDYA